MNKSFRARLLRTLLAFYLSVLAITTASAQVGIGSPKDRVSYPDERTLSFEDFVKDVSRGGMFADQMQSNVALRETQGFLLKRYVGVRPAKTLFEDGITFDCFRILDQPAARELGLRSIPTPPAFPPSIAHSTTLRYSAVATPADRMRQCDTGTVPVMRLTMEELGRAGSLGQYMQKDSHLSRPSTSGESNTTSKSLADLSGWWVGTLSQPGTTFDFELTIGAIDPKTGEFSGGSHISPVGASQYYDFSTLTLRNPLIFFCPDIA